MPPRTPAEIRGGALRHPVGGSAGGGRCVVRACTSTLESSRSRLANVFARRYVRDVVSRSSSDSRDPEILRAILRDLEDRLAESTGQLKRVEGQLARRDQLHEQELAAKAREIAERDAVLATQAAELQLERQKRAAVE